MFRFMLLTCKTHQTQSKVQTEFKLFVLFIRCLSYYIFIDYDSCTHKFVKLIHLLKLSDIRIFKFDLNLHRQLMSRLVYSKLLWTHWAFICSMLWITLNSHQLVLDFLLRQIRQDKITSFIGLPISQSSYLTIYLTYQTNYNKNYYRFQSLVTLFSNSNSKQLCNIFL